MGGLNQATCPAATQSNSNSGSSNIGNKVRFHENQGDGEIHFHDETVKLKCAIATGIFVDQYDSWRKNLSQEEIEFIGHDGKGGRSKVWIRKFINSDDTLDTMMKVSMLDISSSLQNLDKMAGL